MIVASCVQIKEKHGSVSVCINHITTRYILNEQFVLFQRTFSSRLVFYHPTELQRQVV